MHFPNILQVRIPEKKSVSVFTFTPMFAALEYFQLYTKGVNTFTSLIKAIEGIDQHPLVDATQKQSR